MPVTPRCSTRDALAEARGEIGAIIAQSGDGAEMLDDIMAGPVAALLTQARAAEQEFLAASTAVWREIDRLGDEPGGYQGLDASTELRRRERAAWESYRAVLDAGQSSSGRAPAGGEEVTR